MDSSRNRCLAPPVPHDHKGWHFFPGSATGKDRWDQTSPLQEEAGSTYPRKGETSCTSSAREITSWLKITRQRRKFSYASVLRRALRTWWKEKRKSGCSQGEIKLSSTVWETWIQRCAVHLCTGIAHTTRKQNSWEGACLAPWSQRSKASGLLAGHALHHQHPTRRSITLKKGVVSKE